MPIEIRELHIRVAVNATQGNETDGSLRPADSGEGADEMRKNIVSECVEQVLRILQNKMER